MNGELSRRACWRATRALSGCCCTAGASTHSSSRSTLNAPGFATTSFSRTSCAWNCAERLPMRFLTSTAGPRGGSSTAGTLSRQCGTWSRPATGPMPRDLSPDHSFRWVLDGQEGNDSHGPGGVSGNASADHPDLALAHAAAELNQGRIEEAAAQLALAESHVQSAPPVLGRRLSVAIASLRLALARRSGQFSEVIDQVKLLDASIADASSEPLAMGSELRVALLNLGIVETWSGDSCRCRAARHRRSDARPDDRPTA